MPEYQPVAVIGDPMAQRDARVSSFGHFITAVAQRIMGGTNEGASLDTAFWTSTTANGGTVSSSATTAHAHLRTNTGANGSAKITSVRVARFLSGFPNIYLAGIRLGDTGVANNVRRWGVFDSNEGAFFELSGTTIGIVTRKGGSDTRVTTFNGVTGGFTLDTDYHVYEIMYSSGTAQFFQDRKLVHTVTATTDGWSNTVNLKICAENTNSGGSTTDASMYVRGSSVSRLGPLHGEPTFYHTTTNETKVLKTGPGRLHRVVVGVKGTGGATLTIYDNTAGSGTIIGVVDLVNTLGSIEFGTDTNVGLTIVTTSTVGDVTLVYD